MKKALDWFDAALDDFVDRNVLMVKDSEAETYSKSRRNHIDNPKLQDLTESLNTLHSNVSALLTHISAMIAALGIILIVFEDSKMTQAAIFVEIIGYALLAMLCLLCLRFRSVYSTKVDDSDDDYFDIFRKFYLYKRNIYKICMNGVFTVTFFFLITILAHLQALAL